MTKNGITDIAVCFNVFNAYSSGSASKVKKMLTQKGGIPAAAESDSSPKTPKKGNSTQASAKPDDASEQPEPAQVNETPVQEPEKSEPVVVPATPEKTEDE